MSNQESQPTDVPADRAFPGTSFTPVSRPETIELPSSYLLSFQATFAAAKDTQYHAYRAMIQQFVDDCSDSITCETCNDIHGYDQEPSAVMWNNLEEEMRAMDENRVTAEMLENWVERAEEMKRLFFEEVEGTECDVLKEKLVRVRPKVWDRRGGHRGGRSGTFQRGHGNGGRGGRGGGRGGWQREGGGQGGGRRFNGRSGGHGQAHRNPSDGYNQWAYFGHNVDETQQTQQALVDLVGW